MTVYSSVRQLEDLGTTVVTASDGLDETSSALDRASVGLRDTGRALGDIPFLGSSIGRDVTQAAEDVDTISAHVRRTAREARVSGVEARDSAQGLALALGAAVALVPTLPTVVLYLLLRPLVAQRLMRE